MIQPAWLWPCLREAFGAFASPGSSKSQKLPRTGLATPKSKICKAPFTLTIQKLLSRSFPSFYRRTVFFLLLTLSILLYSPGLPIAKPMLDP